MVGCVLQRQGNEDRSRKTYHRPIYSYTTVDSDVFHHYEPNGEQAGYFRGMSNEIRSNVQDLLHVLVTGTIFKFPTDTASLASILRQCRSILLGEYPLLLKECTFNRVQ